MMEGGVGCVRQRMHGFMDWRRSTGIYQREEIRCYKKETKAHSRKSCVIPVGERTSFAAEAG